MEQTGVRTGRRAALSGSALKLIAIGTMFIDHIGAVVIEQSALEWSGWRGVDFVLRAVGRLAFPLFCFLLVQGFLHTRSAPRYLARLAVFAVVSELPFDLATGGCWYDFRSQNVFFTLAAGLATLMALRWCLERKGSWRYWFWPAALAAGCAAATLLRADYAWKGVLLIALFYLLRENRPLCCLTTGLLLAWMSLVVLGTAVFALIPIHLYSGEKGRPMPKYLFYWFYPAHLLALFLVRFFLLGVPLLQRFPLF